MRTSTRLAGSRRFLLMLALCLVPRLAAASPVTYTFAGQWGFYDPQQDTPDFWAAMNSVGVYDLTPFTWSMSFDDAAPGDVFSDFKINNLEYTYRTAPSSANPAQDFSFAGLMNGPVIRGPQSDYYAAFLQFDSLYQTTPLQVGDTAHLFFAFNQSATPIGAAQFLDTSNVTLQSINRVPEPATMWPLMFGVAAAALTCRRWLVRIAGVDGRVRRAHPKPGRD
jgi:hypothetical protein